MKAEEKIDLFSKKIIESFGENIKCIILTGSYSRGEETKDSDIDMWLFFEKLSLEEIKKVGKILKRIPEEPVLNPQCVEIKEGFSEYFKREYSPIQYNTDGIILYGKLPEGSFNLSFKEFLSQSKALAAYVIMGIRHYISTNESKENLLKRKLKKRVLKPTIWAIRYKYASIYGVYFKSLEHLKKVCNKEEGEIISIFQDFLKGDLEKHKDKAYEIIEKTYEVCSFLLKEN